MMSTEMENVVKQGMVGDSEMEGYVFGFWNGNREKDSAEISFTLGNVSERTGNFVGLQFKCDPGEAEKLKEPITK